MKGYSKFREAQKLESISYSLVSYPGHSLSKGLTPSSKVQSAFSTTTADIPKALIGWVGSYFFAAVIF